MEPSHLPGWNFCFTTPVRFRDIDMFDHVNNAVYLSYVESARVAYYSQVTGLQDPHDFDMTVARIEIDFKKPIFFPATINVFTRAARIGTKSWTLEHELRDAANSDLLATCTGKRDPNPLFPIPGVVIWAVVAFLAGGVAARLRARFGGSR